MAGQDRNGILPLHSRTLRQPNYNNTTTTSTPQTRGRLPGPQTTWQPPKHHHHRLQRRRANLSGIVPNKIRNELIAFIAEFCGTFMFLFFAFVGTQVANEAAMASAGGANNAHHSLAQAPNAETLLYISLAFGFSLAVNVWIFFRISGGLFNPVVSLALFLIGAVGAVRAALCFVAQILGGIAAAAVVQAILPGPLNISTALGGADSIARGLFLEMFLTSELVLAILFLAAEKHKATYLAPIGIGLSLFVAELCGVYYTGGSLNPARSFGPDVVTGYFNHYHWIYWVGPLLGSLLAVAFYKLMKLGDYETVNPGQDFNEEEADLFKPPTDAETADDVRRPNPTVVAAQRAVQSAVQQSAQETAQTVAEEVVRAVSPEAVRSPRGSVERAEEERRADLRYSQASTLEGGMEDPEKRLSSK